MQWPEDRGRKAGSPNAAKLGAFHVLPVFRHRSIHRGRVLGGHLGIGSFPFHVACLSRNRFQVASLGGGAHLISRALSLPFRLSLVLRARKALREALVDHGLVSPEEAE